MAVSYGAMCAMFMLFVFNSIFFLSGAALLGVGIWIIADPSLKQLLNIIELANDSDQMRNVAYVLIGIGVFVFVVGFLGCWGAIRKSKVMLGVYISLLLIVMGVEITAGVLAIVFQEKVKKELAQKMSKKLTEDHYYINATGQYHPFGAAFNFAQKEFTCCGVNGSDDYKTDTFKKQNPGFDFPFSCCKLKDGSDFTTKSPKQEDVANWTQCKDEFENLKIPEKYSQLHKIGCKKGIQDWAETKLTMLIGIGLGIAVLELFGYIFALCLCRNIDPDKQQLVHHS